MVHFKKLLTAVFVAGFAVGLFSYVEAQTTTVSLVGKLIDPEGRAVKDTGARVIAFREGELVRETMAAGDGRYELSLTSGTWIVFVDVKPGIGFLNPDTKIIVLPQGIGAYTWNPVLERASGVIVGSLRNESGGSLGRTLVNIVNLVSGKLSSSEEAEEGSYGIPVSRGTYSIKAFSADGGVVNPAAEQRIVESGFADLKMVFRQSDGTISGEIGGAPVGSTVSVAAWSDGGHRNEVGAETVQDVYRYVLKVKQSDVWHIRAAAAGLDGRIYESVEYSVDMGNSKSKIQNFLLMPSASQTLPPVKTNAIDGSVGGSVVLSNGMVVSIPRQPGIATNLTVSISPSFIASPKQSIIGLVYRVSASPVNGAGLDRIDSGVVVGIPYADLDIARGQVKDVKRLRVSFWDEAARAWRIVPHSTVDAKKKVVYGYTKYLALFGVGGEEEITPEPIPTPTPVTVEGSSSSGGPTVVTQIGVTSPSNLSVVATSAGFLSIRWFDFILKNGEVHDVERAPGTSFEFAIIAQGVQSPYIDTTVQAGVTYRYRVVARDTTGATAPSESEIGTAPSDASAPAVTAIFSVIQERNAAVSVTSNEQAIIAVRCLPVGGAGSAVEVLLTNLVQAATVALAGLNSGTDYSCDVTGTDAYGNTSVPVKVAFRTLGVQATAQVAPPVVQPPVQPTPQPPAPPSFTFTRNLALGSTGTDVRALQQVLVRRGDLRIVATTQFFGQATRAALIAFQIRNGLPGTGFFGPQTRFRVNSGIYQ